MDSYSWSRALLLDPKVHSSQVQSECNDVANYYISVDHMYTIWEL